MPSSRTIALAGLASAALLSAGVSAATAAAPSAHLYLGPANQPETRTTETLQPGVTLTRITRGEQVTSLRWVLEALIPSTGTTPDPDAPPRAISDEASAHAQALSLIHI